MCVCVSIYYVIYHTYIKYIYITYSTNRHPVSLSCSGDMPSRLRRWPFLRRSEGRRRADGVRNPSLWNRKKEATDGNGFNMFNSVLWFYYTKRD